jgi:peptidoglycan/LPS O-acetylase OafA/YrhL
MEDHQERLYLLDIARAFAAFTVVLQHYQHFYIYKSEQVSEIFLRSSQPFFEFIGFAYNFGSQAVPFFFMLSGFIFFSFYFKKISLKKISFKNFFILRLSRLYPLHFLTLIITIFFQLIYMKFQNNYFIYEDNNIRSFFEHLFLIQEWPLMSSNSINAFNAPSFSISVEMFLYITFFFISLNYAKNLTQIFIIIIFTLIFYSFVKSTLALGLILFFVGGFLFYLLKKIEKNLDVNKYLIIVILTIVNLVIFSRYLNDSVLHFQFKLEPIFGNRLMILSYFVKFPLIIIDLCIIQFFFKNIGKQLQILGDISYTVYLIHFPVQIIFHLINIEIFKINYDNNFIFIFFIFVITLFSILTYKFYELPLKKKLRSKLLN